MNAFAAVTYFFFSMCDFNIRILNLNRARADFKKAALVKVMDIKNIDIMLVQETHSCQTKESEVQATGPSERVGGLTYLFYC